MGSALTTLAVSIFGYTIDSTLTSFERELLGSATTGVFDLDCLVGLTSVLTVDYLKSTFYGVGLTSDFAGVGFTFDFTGVGLTNDLAGVYFTSDF